MTLAKGLDRRPVEGYPQGLMGLGVVDADLQAASETERARTRVPSSRATSCQRSPHSSRRRHPAVATR